MDPLQHIDKIARESYGRLLAYLGAATRDLAAAEDALAEALHSALTAWPRDGLPTKPEAWLLAVARRRLVDRSRRDGTRTAAASTLAALAELDTPSVPVVIPDRRLELLFICAHPAIDPAVRTPLMLQTVLGLDAARIASAFLIAPAAMGQRLVRAKTKIRTAGIPFVAPEPAELPARLDAVLEAIYAAYGTGWDDAFAADEQRRGLADEAIWLARVLQQLLPDSAETLGLLALMLHCEARRPARRSAAGDFVPLSDQDPRRWNHAQIEEAETLLRHALALGAPARFQLEACIQSAHAERRFSGPTNWASVVGLYDALIDLAPTLGAHLARIAALANFADAGIALQDLDRLPADRVAHHQPYWALRAHLLTELGRTTEADEARTRAIGLTSDPAVRRFLSRR